MLVQYESFGAITATTANLATVNLTSGTITTTPVNNTDIVNKEYADAIASGIHFHEAVAYSNYRRATRKLRTTTARAGVNATLTGKCLMVL